MSTSRHAVSRAVQQLAVGATVDLERRRALTGADALGEIIHQFQVPVSGTCDELPTWANVPLSFAAAFHDATGQRDSPYAEPNFTYGVMLTSATPVVVCAAVMSWTRRTDHDAIIGAVVAVGVFNPDGKTDFDGYVHLSFQGYGAPIEDHDALDVGT